MNKRVFKLRCMICKKENSSFPICEGCKKREDYNTLNIAPKREELAYRFVQWQNHHSNIQEIKNLLDKASKTENELHFTLSEMTFILQNYTTVKIQVDWVTSDKAVISWEDKVNKHKTIPVDYFLEAIETVRPDRDKLTKNDLRNLFRKREADKLNN